MNTKILGTSGEGKAAKYLMLKGYEILETNFSNKVGEIDIIAKDKNYIVFVEVKTRTSKLFGLPCEAVNFRKQQKIRQVSLSYMKAHGILNRVQSRFDVIEVIGEDIRHIENAF